MKKTVLIASSLFILFVIIGVMGGGRTVYNASDFGVLPENSGDINSRNLQTLINKVSARGGVIYIPEGEYRFCKGGTQMIGDHCIKMRSNVTIRGAGGKTVLMPQGDSQYGLDMFYFNEYLDTGRPIYLENCTFESFVIDASQTSCAVYTSAGKGFMLNLIRDCHWKNVTVRDTDATGFGVDCPLNCSITDCAAIRCGKAASEIDPGASGFGIGYGFTDGETMTISDCVSFHNKKFGFFFEHQGRFDPERYDLSNQGRFLVYNCTARENLYNFGGICAKNVTYHGCNCANAGNLEVYFEDCENCNYNGKGLEDYAQ